jgi:hypothetical protein
LATTLVAAAATLAISGLSFVEFAYRSPESHVALETAAGLVCLLACWLMLGRFRRSHQLADLVASLGLGVLAFANLAFLVIPATIERNRAEGLEVWAPVGAGTVGAVIFAAAAFTPQRRIVHRDVAIRRGVAAILAVFLVIAAAAALFSESSPWRHMPSPRSASCGARRRRTTSSWLGSRSAPSSPRSVA